MFRSFARLVKSITLYINEKGTVVLKNTTIKKKLVILFLLASLVPMLTVGLISYSSFKNAIVNKITLHSQEAFSQTAMNLEMKINSYENITLQLLNDDRFGSSLRTFLEADEIELFIHIVELQQFFDGCLLGYPEICGLFF